MSATKKEVFSLIEMQFAFLKKCTILIVNDNDEWLIFY